MNFNEIAKIMYPLALDERAKVVENVVRYLVMLHLHISSLAYAKQLLKRFEKDSQLLGWLDKDEKRLTDICLGVSCELEFYLNFWNKLALAPTLDAGCAFDFVGKTTKNSFWRIDVTHNVERKKEKSDELLFGGPPEWKKVFVQVKGKECRFYNEKFKSAKPTTLKSFNEERGLKAPAAVWNLEYFVARHRWLHFVELGGTENLVLTELATAQKFYSVPSGMLYAHVLFYIRYKQLLKLVPTLSCGDCTDFIGETSGQLMRYYLLTDTKGYVDNKAAYLMDWMKLGFNYKVVVFDRLTREFAFHEVNDFIGIDPNHGCPFR